MIGLLNQRRGEAQRSTFTAAGVAVAGVMVVLLVILGWQESPDPPWPMARVSLRSELLGCYELHDRRGAPLDSSYYNASARIRLDSAHFQLDAVRDARGSAWRLIALDHPRPGRHPHDENLHWMADAGSDSIRLNFTTGYSGAAMILSAPPGADTLRGRVVQFWDLGPPFETHHGHGSAVRIPCPRGT